MPVKIFYAQGNKQIDELESEIDKWQKRLISTANVTHVSTAMTEHEETPGTGDTRMTVTIWYEL